jgi:hypothetical protein
MITSLQKVQKQWEKQRTELLEQWAEARVLWEDERSFLIDERNAVMIEYKNIAVEKAKLQKELSTVLEEFIARPPLGPASSMETKDVATGNDDQGNSATVPGRPPCLHASPVFSKYKDGAWQEYTAELRLGTFHLMLPTISTGSTSSTTSAASTSSTTSTSSTSSTASTTSTTPKITSFTLYQAHAKVLPPSTAVPSWPYSFQVQLNDERNQTTNTSNATTLYIFLVQSAQDRDQWVDRINHINTQQLTPEEHHRQVLDTCLESGSSELCNAVQDYIARITATTNKAHAMNATEDKAKEDMAMNGKKEEAEKEDIEQKGKLVRLIRPLARIQRSPVASPSGIDAEEALNDRLDADRQEKITKKLAQLKLRMANQKRWGEDIGDERENADLEEDAEVEELITL